MKHIGMDVHSTTTDLTVLNAHGKTILHRQIPTRHAEHVELIKSIPGKKQAVVEESAMADWVARLLEPHVTKLIRCQPQHNRLISESEKKCDQEDSHNLAELSYLRKLKPVHHPTQVCRGLREGIHAYWHASGQVTRAKDRLKAFFLFNGIEKQQKQVYSLRRRASMLKRIESSAANPKLGQMRYWELDSARRSQLEHLCLLQELARPVRDKVELLSTIPGIGEIGAHTLVAYLEDGWAPGEQAQALAILRPWDPAPRVGGQRDGSCLAPGESVVEKRPDDCSGYHSHGPQWRHCPVENLVR